MDTKEQFKKLANDYSKMINDYTDGLLLTFGSNKKARIFLREQLAFYSNSQTHELIDNLIRNLEQLALNQ